MKIPADARDIPRRICPLLVSPVDITSYCLQGQTRNSISLGEATDMNLVIVYSSLILNCMMVMVVLQILLCVSLLMSTLSAVLIEGM